MSYQVSIVVPVYNVEKYLRQCLDSVLAQTYSNIEVILVDDGSLDKSGSICDEYAEKYNNFKVIHKKNAGLGMARNNGLEYATGEYVMFLDSDDYIDSDLVEKLYNAVRKYHIDVCRCGCRDVNTDGTVINETVYPLELFEGKEVVTAFLPRLIGSAPDKKDSFGVSVWASIYNNSVIKKYRIQFHSEREFISEDVIFNIDYMQYANGGGVIPIAGYNYRQNVTSLTRKYRSNKYKEIIKLHQYVKQRLNELTDSTEALFRVDKRFFVGVKGCIYQEKKKLSGHTYGEAIQNINMICCDHYIQTLIKSYPVKRLSIKQRVFIYMIKYKLSLLLLLCAELGIG